MTIPMCSCCGVACTQEQADRSAAVMAVVEAVNRYVPLRQYGTRQSYAAEQKLVQRYNALRAIEKAEAGDE